MDKKDEEFLKRLQATFRIEAEEHIRKLSSGLIELEKNPKNNKAIVLIETIFREVHSLKGAARSVNRNDIESICQVLESAFAKLKNEPISFSAVQFDLIHKALNTISNLIPDTGKKTPDNNVELIKQLESFMEANQSGEITERKTAPVKEPALENTQSALPANKLSVQAESVEEESLQLETVRIQTAKLDPLFLQAEQMIQSKVAAAQRTADLKNINDFIGLWKTELGKWDTRHHNGSEPLFKETIHWIHEKLDETAGNLTTLIHDMESDQRSLGYMIDDHVESMKKILMLPISSVIEVFPRLVRDLARAQDKEVELIVHGKEIEVDKRILEELKDPLIHLIRNCIDHGLKKPDERRKLIKPSHGTITLTFLVNDGHNLEITISDDGAGINEKKVIFAAIKAGIISKDDAEKLSPRETLDLIFNSGITTSPIITDISGRGLGLAIVREKVEKLGGTVSVECKPDIGTTFRLILPLSLSTLRGVLVRTEERFFFIPTVNVKCVVKINNAAIRTAENRETILLGNEIIGIVKLSDVLGFNDRTKAPFSQKGNMALSSDIVQLVVLKQGDTQIGFKVDEIINESQILIKSLGKQLSHVRNISGATVLGSGKVVPVIHVPDLMKSALQTNVSAKESKEKETVSKRDYKILVIDDSITSRSLIKNIVETAGYLVETAVDGIDAYTKTLTGEFDLIVSDVDMPGMNGFELTAKIRKEKKLSELPVVLVTALESREDREYGIDVGANAYIVKSSFDQSNLLEVIRKLL
jgi:two-component system chemotaxis sensor kinase CheA